MAILVPVSYKTVSYERNVCLKTGRGARCFFQMKKGAPIFLGGQNGGLRVFYIRKKGGEDVFTGPKFPKPGQCPGKFCPVPNIKVLAKKACRG